MKIDQTVRVELTDKDIRAAIEAYVHAQLEMIGRGDVPINATAMRISAQHPDPNSQSLDYELSAVVEFEPPAKAATRSNLNEVVPVPSAAALEVYKQAAR